MNKTFAVYLFLLGLIVYVHAADINVNVGGPNGENIFVPEKIVATPGDNVIFTWVSGKHSVIETDSLTNCAKSANPNAFSSEGAFTAPKTWTLAISLYYGVGKTWLYCGVPGHCTPGTGGMAATLLIGGNNATYPYATYPSDKAKAASGVVADSPENNNTPVMVGAIIGSLVSGSILTIGSFLLYKKYKKYNKNKNVILVPGENKNNFNSGQVHNNTKGYNHRHEAQEATTISVNENQVHNNTNVYNHGQEANINSENNDNSNLKDYITQIVRQEMMQNQKK